MGALRAPLAGSSAFVVDFVFVSMSVLFDLRNETSENWLTDPRHEQKTAYVCFVLTKCVSNDRSHHDDQNEYRIIKNGAILKG